MLYFLAVDFDFALADVAEGLEELSTPVAGMLEAYFSFQRVYLG